jgi:hypothetical protein
MQWSIRLFKPNLGCVVPHQRELLHHEKEILFRRTVSPPSQIPLGAGSSYFIIKRLKKLDLLFLAALNEIFAVQVAGACIHVRHAAHKRRPLLFVIPLRNHQIDEFIHSRRFGAGSIGLRNDELGDGCNHIVLLRIESLECGLLGQLIVRRLKQGERLSRQ